MKKKNFFLISFLPALAYWYLEENYSLKVAIIGGLGLSVLELSLEKIFIGHLHSLSKFNFFLILCLGGVSLLGDDGIWFKLQPFFTGIFMSGYILWRLSGGRGLMLEMSQSLGGRTLPPNIMNRLEKHMALFLLFYGFFMGAVAFLGTTDQWLFFKTLGFYGTFLLFMLVEFFLLKQTIRENS